MSASRSFPFYLNIESLSAWLETISDLAPVNAGSQLNQAINQLRKADCESTLVLPLLLKLTPTTLHLATALSNLIKPGPQEKKSAKIAKLSLQLLRNLALAFHSILETEYLSAQQKLQAIYIALQLIGQYLRLSNLFHELPSETLWQRSGDLFFIAQKNDGLQQDIAVKITDFRHQTSIEQVLKRNLLFTIIAFHEQSATDSEALFTFANQHSTSLQLMHGQSGNARFLWNTKKGVPRQIPRLDRPLKKSEIALDAATLLSEFNPACFADAINDQEIERVKLLLSGYEQAVNETIPSAPIVFTMLAGFDRIHEFLNRLEKINRIHKLSAQIPEQKQHVGFSLEPLEHEKSLLSGFSKPKEDTSSPNLLQGGYNVKLLQSKNKHFIHVESKQADWEIGDLVLLVNKKNAFMAGKILQIEALTNTQASMVLIEKIGGTLSTQAVQSEQCEQTASIVINLDSDRPEILFNYDKFRNGMEFKIGQKTARLVSLLDYSPFFVRYRIGF